MVEGPASQAPIILPALATKPKKSVSVLDEVIGDLVLKTKY